MTGLPAAVDDELLYKNKQQLALFIRNENYTERVIKGRKKKSRCKGMGWINYRRHRR